MDPATLGTGVSLAQGVFGALRSFSLGRKAKKIDTSYDPYTIPKEYFENRSASRNLVNQGGMAGYGRASDQIDRGMASTLGQMQQVGGSAADLLSGVATAQGQRNDASLNLAGMAAQSQGQAMDRLADDNTALADQKEKEWQYNEFLPAQERMREKRILEGESRKSLDGAFNSLTNAAAFGAMGGIGGGGGGVQAPAMNPWDGQQIAGAGGNAGSSVTAALMRPGYPTGSSDQYTRYGRRMGVAY